LIEHFLQPDACVAGLIEEVRHFGAGSEHTDDATVMLIRQPLALHSHLTI
jgi:sigma-B regulation protein RsbU (phosphoserine phosphatase)